jgi:peptidoglycan L-alanyl-D-glutamate endopeptidase CwlK
MNSFGAKSKRELLGVHSDLVICTTTTLLDPALEYDFTVFDGLRTEVEQTENVRRKVSWTMNSMHLPQVDGFAWAVDLVPIINGNLSWDNADEAFKQIADAMFRAAKHHNIEIEWGFKMWQKDKPHFQLKRVPT